MKQAIRPIAAAILLAGFSSGVFAHVARLTSAAANVASDGRVSVSIEMDVISYALNDSSERVADAAMDKLLDGPDEELQVALAAARNRLGREVRLSPECVWERVDFPMLKEVREYLATNPTPRLPVVLTATLEGRVPVGTEAVAARFPEVLGTVVLTVQRPGEEMAAVAANPGEMSEPVRVHLEPTLTRPARGAAKRGEEEVSNERVPFFRTLAEFVTLGFKHILPEGLDHILFVLGLFLLSSKVKPLLWQVTAFTVAHSMTLGLSLYGVVHLPSSVVEPLIAASIAFVAIENLFTTKLNPWRPAVVFGFGLVHGLGFSAALTDLHLARASFLPALVGFNCGVELGQMAVIGMAFLAVGWFRAARWYRPVVAVPASVAIAAMGLFWMVQRVVAP